MYYSELAEEYYEAACPKFAINGYEKNVLIDTDTERCIFISGDIELNEEHLLFRCKRSRGTLVEKLKQKKNNSLRRLEKYTKENLESKKKRWMMGLSLKMSMSFYRTS